MLASHLRAGCSSSRRCAPGRRNPQFYADILASSLAGAGALHPRAGARARAPRAVEAAPDAAAHSGGARQHQGSARHLRQGRHRDDARRAEVHRRGSAARLRRASTTCTCSAISPTRRPKRRRRSASYIEYLETEIAPKARASFRLGRDKFEQKLRLDEGISLPVDRLLAIATRELKATQEAFRALAGPHERRRSARRPGRARRPSIRRPGELVDVGREQLDELATFLERQSHHHAAGRRADHRRADAGLLPLVVRQHVDAGPVRDASRRAPTTT